MTFDNLYACLKSTGIPQKRVKSAKSLSPPFMVISEGQKELRGSDDSILLTQYSPIIELYTTADDYDSAEKISALLISHGISFTSSEDIQIDGEDLFVRYFYLENQFSKLQEVKWQKTKK